MSTIGGLLNTHNSIKHSDLIVMRNAIDNKYSDSSEVWSSKSIGMFCNLLWTTEESKREILPLNDPVHHCSITADARIDNRPELIKLLKISSDSLPLLTDSELILKSYLMWGEECVNYLVGNFAFAIWDTKNEMLFCAKDHLGIRPLYYYHREDKFVFASTIESVRIGANLVKDPDCKILQEIVDRDIQNLSSTVLKHISRLLPAHILMVKEGKVDIKRYWFPEKIPMNTKISQKNAVNGFLSIMNRSIRDHMRSAYPIGCELSGGLDSSTVTSLVHNIPSTQDIYTFSSTYGNLPCDESAYINDISKKLHIEPVYSEADKINYAVYNLSLFYSKNKEWPGRGSFLDSFKEFEAAQKRGVRVILTGQGGDHIATGDYDMLSDYLREGRFIRLFNALKNLNWNKNLIKRYMILPFLPKKIRLLLDYMFKKDLTPIPCSYGLDTSASFLSFSQKNELEMLYDPTSLLWLDSNPYIQLAEYYGIECRHPFFDKRVVEYMLALPPWFKYDGDLTKIIIRLAMKDLFPDSVLHRNDKAEFSTIIEKQMANCSTIDLTNIAQYDSIICSDLLNNGHENENTWNKLCILEWFNVNFQKR